MKTARNTQKLLNNSSQFATVYRVDPTTQAKTVVCSVQSLVDHPLYLESDITYFQSLGLKIQEIKDLWDSEWRKFSRVVL